MRIESTIRRVLFVVDRCLRKEFPDDYDKRCMYGAFATSVLLQDAGLEANIAGGDFLAFVVSRRGDEAGLQGFGLGEDQPSHFWVEVQDTIIDLGPHYLPKRSRYPAFDLPLVAWTLATGLPKYLRYRPLIRYASEAQLQATPDILARKEQFIAQCRERYKTQVGQPKLPGWVLSDQASLLTAARQGDLWALNAIRFSDGVRETDLPF